MTKITAHAGCEGTVPGSRENIETAVRLGADVVEMDLRLLNGEVWLSHDLLDTEGFRTYLTLERALELLCGSHVEINCDLKEPEVFPHALRIIRRMDLESRIIFTGEFNPRLGSCGDQYRYFQNVEHLDGLSSERKLSGEDAGRLARHYQDNAGGSFCGYNISYKMLTPEALEALSAKRIPLSCWTVDDQSEIQALLRADITYLTTNLVRYAVGQRAML